MEMSIWYITTHFVVEGHKYQLKQHLSVSNISFLSVCGKSGAATAFEFSEW